MAKDCCFFAKFDRLLYSDIQTECTSLYGEFELTKKQHIVGFKGSIWAPYYMGTAKESKEARAERVKVP